MVEQVSREIRSFRQMKSEPRCKSTTAKGKNSMWRSFLLPWGRAWLWGTENREHGWSSEKRKEAPGTGLRKALWFSVPRNHFKALIRNHVSLLIKRFRSLSSNSHFHLYCPPRPTKHFTRLIQPVKNAHGATLVSQYLFDSVEVLCLVIFHISNFIFSIKVNVVTVIWCCSLSSGWMISL